ncbi:MAG: hypothetical protein R3E57_08100 [Porticoccaceae bacterium]
MDSKIPIPTDNIYKFLATFGLVLIVSSLTLLIYTYQATNDVVFKNASAIYDLDVSNRSNEDKERRAKLLNREIEIAITNRNIGKWFFSGLCSLGFLICIVGFERWFKHVQPEHDRSIKLQNQKLELELAALNNSSQPDAQNTHEAV